VIPNVERSVYTVKSGMGDLYSGDSVSGDTLKGFGE
jgi:hypothetical protein